MRLMLDAFEGEYRRYKTLAENAAAQLDDAHFAEAPAHSNSVAITFGHLGGNLRSRFADFLTADGEKPWRDRESEFQPREGGRAAVMALWEEGWGILFASLAPLDDADLARTVTIRGTALSVADALARSLAHAAYHVGEVVQRARQLQGDAWRFLSIPPGMSDAYNRDPRFEKPPKG